MASLGGVPMRTHDSKPRMHTPRANNNHIPRTFAPMQSPFS
eukprot:CCRYP_009501-RA/>CCRYP_009501-RA protein AED:0.00 eAED:0.00 QI:88/1/1/1/0/0/2/0/40